VSSKFKAFAKIFYRDGFIFIKVEVLGKTKVFVIDHINGDKLKTLDFDFKFDVFFVMKKKDLTTVSDPLAELDLVFFREGTYFVYDMVNEKCVFTTMFQSSVCFFNLICLNREDELVSLAAPTIYN
jgi:hypothetical protein